jgi:hypothetical protein
MTKSIVPSNSDELDGLGLRGRTAKEREDRSFNERNRGRRPQFVFDASYPSDFCPSAGLTSHFSALCPLPSPTVGYPFGSVMYCFVGKQFAFACLAFFILLLIGTQATVPRS